MRRRSLSVALVVILVSSAPVAAVATITIAPVPFNISFVRSIAFDGLGVPGSSVNDVHAVSSLPATGTATAVDGASSCTTGYSLSDLEFDLTFDHVRPAASNTGGHSFVMIFFTSNVDIGYAISGVYSSDASDPASTLLDIDLFDRTTSTYLFENSQDSRATPGESFVVGQSGGDYGNFYRGSPTGNLIAGRTYQFVVHTSTYADILTPVTAPAHGTGYVTLAFVPEPSTAMLLAAGILALAAGRRRR